MEIKRIIRKLDFPGYNFSFKKTENGYIGTIRKQTHGERCNYPECHNSTYILHLNNDFNIISNYLLNENTELLPRFVNWSAGLEDARLLDDKSALCVSLDTNPHWKTEMAYFEFSNEEKKITKFVRFHVDGEEGMIKNEKNWLFLNKTDDKMNLLYSYDPIQIISVDLNTGMGTIIKSYNKNNIKFNSHGGSCVFINKINKYLVTIRNYTKNEKGNDKYSNNYWLLFDHEYELCGISQPFVFETIEQFSDTPYQMCMTLYIENDILYSAVSIQDSFVNIYKFNIDEILHNIEIII
jgi:hypothetical protein